MSSNSVLIDPQLTVSGVSASQGIQSGPAEAGVTPDWVIESYAGNALAPWESVAETASGITWLQDMDAFTDSSGAQAAPSDFFFPAQTIDASTGVLEFAVTIPDEVGGEVFLFDSMTASFTSAEWNTDTGEITPLEDLVDTIEGCSVTVETIEDPSDDSDPSSPDPDAQDASSGPAAAPKVPTRVDTGL